MKAPLRVVRLYHSAVVAAYRSREHRLIGEGARVVLVTPRRWNEGGRDVTCEPTDGEPAWVQPVRTVGRHPYRFVYSPIGLARAVRALRPDVLDVHEEPASLASGEALLVRRLFARRSSVTFYSAQNIFKRYPPPFAWIERRALAAATAVYCCNSEAAAVIARKGFRGEIAVIGLGVDVGRFQPRPPRQERDAAFTVGYVGRLGRHKGVHVLIEAIRLLPENVVVEIVGAGPEERRLRREASALGDRVRFRSFVDHDGLPSVYRGFDLVALPSIPSPSLREQFGRAAVEAMASGVPVVVSDCGALPEVVGPAGAIVPPGDAALLADAIEALASDREAWLAAAARGVERSRAYSWEEVARRHYELLQRARP